MIKFKKLIILATFSLLSMVIGFVVGGVVEGFPQSYWARGVDFICVLITVFGFLGLIFVFVISIGDWIEGE